MGLIHEKNQRPKISCYCTFKGPSGSSPLRSESSRDGQEGGWSGRAAAQRRQFQGLNSLQAKAKGNHQGRAHLDKMVLMVLMVLMVIRW